jgi:hypothetical protein
LYICSVAQKVFGAFNSNRIIKLIDPPIKPLQIPRKKYNDPIIL